MERKSDYKHSLAGCWKMLSGLCTLQALGQRLIVLNSFDVAGDCSALARKCLRCQGINNMIDISNQVSDASEERDPGKLPVRCQETMNKPFHNERTERCVWWLLSLMPLAPRPIGIVKQIVISRSLPTDVQSSRLIFSCCCNQLLSKDNFILAASQISTENHFQIPRFLSAWVSPTCVLNFVHIVMCFFTCVRGYACCSIMKPMEGRNAPREAGV